MQMKISIRKTRGQVVILFCHSKLREKCFKDNVSKITIRFEII